MHVGIANPRWRGKTFPAFPAYAQPAIIRIWQETHGRITTLIARPHCHMRYSASLIYIGKVIENAIHIAYVWNIYKTVYFSNKNIHVLHNLNSRKSACHQNCGITPNIVVHNTVWSFFTKLKTGHKDILMHFLEWQVLNKIKLKCISKGLIDIMLDAVWQQAIFRTNVYRDIKNCMPLLWVKARYTDNGNILAYADTFIVLCTKNLMEMAF